MKPQRESIGWVIWVWAMIYFGLMAWGYVDLIARILQSFCGR